MPGVERPQQQYDRSIFQDTGRAKTPARTRRLRVSLQARMFLFTLIILGAIIAAAFLYMRPKDERYVLDNYELITVGTYDFRSLFVTAGRVAPIDTAKFAVPSFGQSNVRVFVERVHVAPGDDVVEGQIVMELVAYGLTEELQKLESDRAAAEIELEQARLQVEQELLQRERELAQAVSDLRSAQEHLELLRDLYAKGGVAKKELDDAEQAVSLRQIQIQTAEQALTMTRQRGELTVRKAENQVSSLARQQATLEEQIAGLTIRSDRDGRVLSVSVAPGSQVSSGNELLSIADLRRQQVEAAITPQQALEVQPGMSAQLRFASRTLPAQVTHVAPVATTTSEGSAVSVRLSLAPEVAETIVPNTDLTVEIELGVRPARTALPRGPFFASGDASFVYVVSEDGRQATRRTVRFGAIEGSMIEIVEGLEPGERIIYSSYSAFRAYPNIQLLPEGGRHVAWP